MLPLIGAAIGGAVLGGSGGGGLFGPSTKSLEPKWQKQMREKLAKQALPGAEARIRRVGEAYEGPLVAKMSEGELKGEEFLKKYLSSELATDTDMFKAASDEITKTLTGEYDPAASEYYRAFRTAVLRELRDANDRLKAQTSARDAYYGGGRIKAAERLEEGATNQMAQVLGDLAYRERQNRLAAVPVAQQLALSAEQIPAGRVAAAQQLGALDRQIRQAQHDAEYQEWLRQLSDLGLSLDVVTGMTTYKPPTAVGPSPASQVAGAVGNIASLLDWA